jgi:hypothetical protein
VIRVQKTVNSRHDITAVSAADTFRLIMRR